MKILMRRMSMIRSWKSRMSGFRNMNMRGRRMTMRSSSSKRIWTRGKNDRISVCRKMSSRSMRKMTRSSSRGRSRTIEFRLVE